jgi:hypothetical protein
MGDRPELEQAARGSADWLSPWQMCKARDRDDRRDREAEKVRRPTRFDGNRSYDSPILFWARRIERRLGALTPWAQFGYLYTRKLCGSEEVPTWMYTERRRRARYYAGDYYVLATTVFVIVWACLTIGLTKPSSWDTRSMTWILLLPVAFLIPLYTWDGDRRFKVTAACVATLALGALLTIFLGVGEWIRWFVPWPLVLREAEILLTLARIVNFDTLEGGYMHTPVSRIRHLYYTILYVVQISFAYSTIYAFWTPTGFYDLTHCASSVAANCAPLTGLNNYIFLSVTTLTTLGSGFVTNGGLPQWLQMSEVGVGILLLAVGLAAFVGSLHLISLQKSSIDEKGSLRTDKD